MACRSGVQGFVEWKPADLKYPIVGYYDFIWEDHGIIVDLKTTERMPSEIKIPHARQVSLYCGDNHQGRLDLLHAEKVPDLRPGKHPRAQAGAAPIWPGTWKISGLER